MGAGIAKQFALRYPLLPALLGKHVRCHGNTPCYIPHLNVMSMPTKENFRDLSTLDLIEKSAKHMVTLANIHNLTTIFLPPPGCGLGGLNLQDVYAVIHPILDDRFILVTR